MVSVLHTHLRDRYLDWLRQSVEVEAIAEGWWQVTLPLVDRHNDLIAVYARQDDDQVLLTDYGETLIDLAWVGWEPTTEPREELLNEIASRYDLSIENGQLTARILVSDLPFALQRMGQAILALNELRSTTPESVAEIFRQDVRKWVASAGYRPEPVESVQGRSLPHRVDVFLRGDRETPSRLLRAFHNPNTQSFRELLTAKVDTQEEHPDWMWIAVLDDSKRGVPAHVDGAFRKHQMPVIPWSRHQEDNYQLLLARGTWGDRLV